MDQKIWMWKKWIKKFVYGKNGSEILNVEKMDHKIWMPKNQS
jgi:hypothetical protein